MKLQTFVPESEVRLLSESQCTMLEQSDKDGVILYYAVCRHKDIYIAKYGKLNLWKALGAAIQENRSMFVTTTVTLECACPRCSPLRSFELPTEAEIQDQIAKMKQDGTFFGRVKR